MTSSIRSRIWQLALVAVVAVVGLCAGFLWSLRQTQTADLWIDHTHTVLLALANHELAAMRAQSAERGYLISGDDTALMSYRRAIAERGRRFDSLRQLVRDNPVQVERLQQINDILTERFALADRVLAAGKSGDMAAALRIARAGRGAALMTQLRALSEQMASTENDLLLRREAALGRQDRMVAAVVILGGAAILIVLILVAAATILRINRPLDHLLGGITSLAKGQKDYQIAITSDDEIGRVGRAFNEMARTLQVANETREAAERELEEANAKLLRRSAQLQERGHAIDLLGKMAHRLQAVTNDAEFAEIVQCFAPQILPGVAGALYLLNNSRSLMTLAAPWGDGAADVAAYFGPQECWALRRGQIHEVIGGGGDVRCQHAGDDDTPYICLPLLAHGDTVGLLYLEGVTQANLARLPLLAENIALALANHRLQQSLREQSIRDPLTGLFNRRYLEESLTLELARASRGNAPVGLMMLDIDHFKRFNDTFGHETGDTLLRAVGQVLPAHVRAGDILCRYGGEEFTIILPGAGLELTRQRAEAIRQAVAELVVRHQGQSVGQITMSIGVSARPTHGTAPAALLMAADAALYRAKGAGRNRVEMAVEANMEA